MTLARRIVVTGLGAVSALGGTAEANWAAARDGICGIRQTVFDPGPFGSPAFSLPAAKVALGYAAPLESRMGRKISGLLDPFALIQLAAAFEALDQARLIGAQALDHRTAIVVGQGTGGVETLEKGYERLFGRKTAHMHPTLMPKAMVSAAASAVAMQFGVHGPVFAVSSACASSAHAILQGAMLIECGLADVALVGGSDAVATPGSMCGWQAIQALAQETCRPFSKGRDGMVLAEGGGALVLEALDHAKARGIEPIAEYVGGGMSSDAHHLTQPSLDGPLKAMGQAISSGGLDDGQQVLISAHGTGTLLNDRNEALALAAAFGARAVMKHPVIATKSAHGHMIGGSAAVQTVIGLKALVAGRAPPILNFLEPDPECDLNLVVAASREISARHLLLNAFAFGGLNASLAFRKL